MARSEFPTLFRIYEPTVTTDEIGGEDETYSQTGTVYGRIEAKKPGSRLWAAQRGLEVTHEITLKGRGMVEQGDQLRDGDGAIFHVEMVSADDHPNRDIVSARQEPNTEGRGTAEQ